MAREISPYVAKTHRVEGVYASPDIEWDTLVAEIDALSKERIGLRESMRITWRMATLLKKK